MDNCCFKFNGQLFNFSGGDVVLDPHALAYFDRVTAAGDTLTLVQKNAVLNLCSGLKSYGLWDSMLFFNPLLGTNAGGFSQNLISSSFTGTYSSGWTFSNLGANGNGTSAFMNTGFNPLVNAPSGANFFLYINHKGTDQFVSRDFGLTNGSTFENGITSAWGRVTIYSSQGKFSGPVQYISAANNPYRLGLYQSNVLGGVHTLMVNNSLLATNNNGHTYYNFPLYMGASNQSNTAVTHSDKRYAAVGVSLGLTTTQMTNLRTVIESFETELSRQAW